MASKEICVRNDDDVTALNVKGILSALANISADMQKHIEED